MTVPIYIQQPPSIGFAVDEIPHEIVVYCANFTQLDPYDEDNRREQDLRLIDCYWMHLGYYGTPPKIMEEVRRDFFRNRPPVLPVFD